MLPFALCPLTELIRSGPHPDEAARSESVSLRGRLLPARCLWSDRVRFDRCLVKPRDLPKSFRDGPVSRLEEAGESHPLRWLHPVSAAFPCGCCGWQGRVLSGCWPTHFELRLRLSLRSGGYPHRANPPTPSGFGFRAFTPVHLPLIYFNLKQKSSEIFNYFSGGLSPDASPTPSPGWPQVSSRDPRAATARP
mgnify:CR=1 FL=1